MPKEVFNSGTVGNLTAGWWSSEQVENGPEHIGPWVDFSIGGLGKFTFVNDESQEVYDRLYTQIDSVEEVDRLIKTLERIKRKVFNV